MNDLIERQAAIDALWKALYAYEDETEKKFQENEEFDLTDWFLLRIFIQNMSDIDRQTILALPSVTPKPRTGRWLINSDGYYPYCSECKAEPKSSEMTDFCPKCGAKMEAFK